VDDEEMIRIVLVVALAACGRVGFDEGTTDGSAGGTRIGLELPAGGELDRISVAADGTWYAVSAIGDAYRSDDGMAWVRCGDAVVSNVIENLDGVVYAGGADVLLSTDRCATWQPTGIDRYTQAVAIHKTDVYALTDIGLRVRDGTTWVPVATPLDTARFNELASCENCPWVLGTNSGLMHSLDGVTWNVVPSSQLPTGNIIDVASSPTHTYAITSAGGASSGGVVCSDGSAGTWTSCYDDGGTAIAVDPTNDQHAFAAIYDGLLETHDAFATYDYDKRGGEMGAAIVHHMAFLPDGALVAATDRGAYYAAPGTTAWEARHTGLATWNINDIARTGDELYLATEGGVIHGVVGQSYTASFAGLADNTLVNAIAVTPDGTPLAVGRHVWTSADHGATWTMLFQLGLDDEYRAFTVTLAGTRAYIGTYTQVYSADPPYQTWTPHTIAGSDHHVTGLLVTGGELWATTTAGVFVSSDQGATFQAVGSLGGATYWSVAQLADGSLAVGTDSDGIWISDATRATWQHVGPANQKVNRIAIAAGAIIASTDNGIYASHDRGLSWSSDATTARRQTRTAFVDPADGQLVVGTIGRGLVKTSIP
jgi:hypothetical protein